MGQLPCWVWHLVVVKGVEASLAGGDAKFQNSPTFSELLITLPCPEKPFEVTSSGNVVLQQSIPENPILDPFHLPSFPCCRNGPQLEL